MNVRTALRSLAAGALLLAAVGAANTRAADITGSAGAAAAAGATNASFPKGHYAELDALPDWGGVWTRTFPKGPRPQLPLLKGKYLQDFQAWQRAVKANHGEAPHSGSYCRPPGMPGIMAIFQYPIEFLFTPGRVTINQEAWMQRRVIFTDGRPHPADLDPTFNGDSIGRWQADTLVVDTVGIKPVVQIGPGMGHSDQLHIVEHIHLTGNDPDTLVDEMTLYDPLALQQPWTTTVTYQRSRNEQLLEFICEENDRNSGDPNDSGFGR
ncbi:MAG TPA: hypothetical protein VHX52_01465 [Steroidobacteraceae bacterium]|jgi:hypothetical protein|nr:hypothetical protein [Steroidobacteraceae bacterium]